MFIGLLSFAFFHSIPHFFSRCKAALRKRRVLTVWVYENTSFELAKNVESQTFPWTEEGVEQIKVWLEQKLEERGSQPYFIPYPAPRAE